MKVRTHLRLLGRLKTNVTVQLLKTHAPQEALQPTVNEKVDAAAPPARSASKLSALASALNAIDSWAPTLRVATVASLLIGGLAAVSMLASANLILASVTVGIAVAAVVSLVFASAVRKAPAMVFPWLPPEAVGWREIAEDPRSSSERSR